MSAPPPAPRRGLLRPALLGALAALVYGGWALHVNGVAGPAAAMRAALTQAGLSFAATFGMSLVLERLFRMGRTPQRGFWLAAVGTSLVSATLMATGHALAGTPRILATIGPSATIATAYYLVYAWGLRVSALRAARGAG